MIGPMQTQTALKLLRGLAVALLGAALIVLGAGLLSSPWGLDLVALALACAAVLCWRVSSSIASSIQESRAWTELRILRETMATREADWSALPAAAALWDSDGRFVFATVGWHSLGLATELAPTQAELAIGEPPRVFVVEANTASSGARLVLLREVTRERIALQAKDELLAIIGHELRTPLSSIKGYGQLMARQLATLQEQVHRLDTLIDDVQDTARAETGRLNVKREPLAIDDVVKAACDRFSAANPSRVLDRQLDGHALIEGDVTRLSQVMDNLLSNAAKYSPAESPISVRTLLEGNWVRIAVADRGMGVSAEHVPHLFERFYRVPDRDAAAPHGVGLGLSIVRDLVEAHGGRVDVASEGTGKGSTFTVSLPIALSLRGPTQSSSPAAVDSVD